jgi:hypothetical protein
MQLVTIVVADHKYTSSTIHVQKAGAFTGLAFQYPYLVQHGADFKQQIATFCIVENPVNSTRYNVELGKLQSGECTSPNAVTTQQQRATDVSV